MQTNTYMSEGHFVEQPNFERAFYLGIGPDPRPAYFQDFPSE